LQVGKPAAKAFFGQRGKEMKKILLFLFAILLTFIVYQNMPSYAE